MSGERKGGQGKCTGKGEGGGVRATILISNTLCHLIQGGEPRSRPSANND